MIPVREQWCIQIDVTNACRHGCSNCTRLLSHARKPFFMPLPLFRQAVETVRDFVTDSTPDHHGRTKVIGIIGGEPLMHPNFPALCGIIRELIPAKEHRGLWTSENLVNHKHEHIIGETFGYLNHNQHTSPCYHQPALVAIQEVIHDNLRMWSLIDDCWLQQTWAGAITPKGAFFCEVAAAFDTVFDGPGGLPIEPGWWTRDLADFADQRDQWCPMCGVALPLPARRDREQRDDITQGNLDALCKLGSPRVKAGQVVVFDPTNYDEAAERAKGWRPNRYLRKGDTRDVTDQV